MTTGQDALDTRFTSPGRTEWEGERFHRAMQDSMQFKTYKLFIFGMFHVIFSDHSRLRVTETVESKIADKGGPPYFPHPWKSTGRALGS